MPSLTAFVAVYVRQEFRIGRFAVIASKDGHPASVSQLDKFKQAARKHEADEDEARRDELLKHIAKTKPAPEEPK